MPIELIETAEVDGIRADIEQLFVDQGRFFRRVGDPILNPNGTADPPPEADIYVGRMSLYPIMSRRDRFDELAEGLVFTRQYRVEVPWSTADIQIRDRLILTVSRDPELVGRELEVRDVIVETNIGMRRITVHDFRE